MDYLEVMKIKIFFVLFFSVLLKAAVGQGADPTLYKKIVHMDSVTFDAFNRHDLAVLMSFFSDSLEFFHDKGGRIDYTACTEGFKGVFKQSPDIHRDLVPGSLEIYPLPGYGAVEMGEHRFTHKENGRDIVGVFKFVHVWEWKDNSWKITRVVSVGH